MGEAFILTVGQVIVFLLGGISVYQAGVFFKFFRKSRSSLSWAMQTFLLEQVISAVGTMVFACNSLVSTITGEQVHLWNNIDPSLAIAIRTVMFLSMIHATATLSAEVDRILKRS